MKSLLTFAVALFSLTVMAQSEKKSVVIGSMTQKPNALLIVNPPNGDQGVLLPQLTTGQRMSLKPQSPAEDGLLVFDTNFKKYYYWNSGSWVELAPSRAETSFYSIDPAHFQPLMIDGNIRHTGGAIFEADNSFATVTRRDYGTSIVAPVSLPHNATIEEITIHYMDNHADDIKVYLFRKSFSGASEEIINWESRDASAEVRSHTLTHFKGMGRIDSENYTYRLVITFDLNNDEEVDQAGEARQRIYGVRIKYQP